VQILRVAAKMQQLPLLKSRRCLKLGQRLCSMVGSVGRRSLTMLRQLMYGSGMLMAGGLGLVRLRRSQPQV
jgi:hypothetical protein